MPRVKTIGNKRKGRDPAPDDHFRDAEARRLYKSCFSRRKPFFERNIVEAELRDTGVPTLLVNRGWGSLLGGFVGASEVFVQEFYSNMEITGPTSFSVFVRGHYLDVDDEVFQRVFSLPEVDHPEYPWGHGQGPSDQVVVDMATGHHRPYAGGSVIVATLLPRYRLLNRITCHNLMPKSHVNTQPASRLAFLYAIDQGVSIDIVDLILREIIHARRQDTSRLSLPFGGLLRRLVSALVPDFVHDAPVPLMAPIGRQTLTSGTAHIAPHHRAPASPPPSAAPEFVPTPSMDAPSSSTAAPSFAAGPSTSSAPPPDLYQRMMESQLSILSQLQLMTGSLSEVRSGMGHLQTRVDWLYDRAHRQDEEAAEEESESEGESGSETGSES